jgi:hypothetical protein
MRRILAFVLFATALCNAQGLTLPFKSRGGAGGGTGTETMRPATDSDPGAVLFGACNGTFQSSSAMALSHDASGTSTFSSLSMNGASTPKKYRVRLFTGWSAATQSYTSLNLKIYSQCTVSLGIPQDAGCTIQYSTNAGSTWNLAESDSGAGWNDSVTPFSVILAAGQNLTQLQVRACSAATGDAAEPDITNMDISDIRTEGIY